MAGDEPSPRSGGQKPTPLQPVVGWEEEATPQSDDGVYDSPVSLISAKAGVNTVQVRPAKGTGTSIVDWMREVSGVSGVSGVSPLENEHVIVEDEADDSPSYKDKSPRTVFADVEAMKEKVRDTLYAPKYNVADLYKHEGFWQRVARSSRFETVSLSFVAANAVWISVDTDYNDQEVLTNADIGFQLMQHLFCAFFVWEWFVRLMAFKNKCNGLKDHWFALDSFLVPLMVFDTWVMSFVVLVTKEDAAWFGDDTSDSSILRLLRLLRLFRMARVVRLLRATPELLTLIKAMAAAVRSVFFTLCLLILVMYVFAVGFTQLYSDTPMGARYFSTVAESMYTLLVHGTFLDEVSGVLREAREASWFAALMFLMFILIAAITVMNMLIGVLCEVVGAAAAIEKEELAVDLVRRKLEGIVKSLDTSNDSLLSQAEFAQLLENSAATKALQEVGVDPVGLVEYADVIFENEIGGHFNKELTFKDFMEVVLELRGSRTASVKDIVNLRKYIRKSVQQSTNQMQQTNDRLARMEAMLQKLGVAKGIPSRSRSWDPTRRKASKNENASTPSASALRKVKSEANLSSYVTGLSGAQQPVRTSSCSSLNSFIAALDMPKSEAQMKGDLQSMTAALEADLALIFEDVQRRMHELTQAMPPCDGSGETSQPQLVEGAAADGGSCSSQCDSKGHEDKGHEEASDMMVDNDLLRLSIIEAEAELLSIASSEDPPPLPSGGVKASGGKALGGGSAPLPKPQEGFFGLGVVPTAQD